MKNEDGGTAAGRPDLKVRTKAFALRVIDLASSLPRTGAGQVIGGQLLRSGTSVGAQYREATRARSDAEYASKVSSALQELEESSYWMELLAESGTVDGERLRGLMAEAEELTRMLVTCSKKARERTRRRSEE